jgi:hypothetical protein
MDSMPVTTRQLEALIRLAEVRLKLLSPDVFYLFAHSCADSEFLMSVGLASIVTIYLLVVSVTLY